jgi:hypothetical protein
MRRGKMASDSGIRINAPNVVGEEFDGEVVVVNLDSGYYFSLLGSAKDIWMALSNGVTEPEKIIALLEENLDCAGVDVSNLVMPFLDEMLALEIVVLDHSTPSRDPVPLQNSDGVRRLFEPPRIETFSDLQDILLLDPIHDVDEAGWPKAIDTSP